MSNQWWKDHDNIVQLTAWMADSGYPAGEVAAAVEKPWKYTDEFHEAVWLAGQPHPTPTTTKEG